MNTLLESVQPKLDDLNHQIKSSLSEFLQVQTPQQLLNAENQFHDLCHQAIGQLFAFLFNHILQQPALRQTAIQAIFAHGQKWKSKGLRDVHIRLASGTTVKVRTPYFVRNHRAKGGRKRKKRGKKGSGCYPVLLALGIKDRITPAAIEKIARMTAVCSSLAESQQQLEKQGISLNIKTIRSLAWSFGSSAVVAQLEKIQRWLDEVTKSEEFLAGKRVVVTVDGGKIRQRYPKKTGRRKKNGRRSFETDWTEPRVICLYVIDEEGKKAAEAESCWYDAAVADADESFEVLAGHLQGLGASKAKEVIFVSDGATWIWNRVEELWEKTGLTGKVVEVVDFYHAAEHLHSVISLRKSWSKKRRREWFEKHRSLLRKGCVEEVVEGIRGLARGRDAKEYAKKTKYFERHIERMRYKEFKEKKIPIGSGAVESAVRRIINQRMKGPGLLWLPESAQAMLLFRAYLKSGRWQELISMTLKEISQIQPVA